VYESTRGGVHWLLADRHGLLERGVSMASLDAAWSDHESHGRSVLGLARDGRAVALAAWQEVPRAHARAAVDQLRAAGIEPVLISSMARATLEALSVPLGIDDVRPEIPRADLREHVRRLTAGPKPSVVVADPHVAAPALASAPLAFAVGADVVAEAWPLSAATDDPTAFASALVIAKRLHALVRSMWYAWISAAAALIVLTVVGSGAEYGAPILAMALSVYAVTRPNIDRSAL
jgi:cation transport ATPase